MSLQSPLRVLPRSIAQAAARLARVLLRVFHFLVRWLQLVAPSGLTRHPAQGLVEYALVLVLVAIVSIAILGTLGKQTSSVFETVKCSLNGGKIHTDNGNGNSNGCK